MVPALAALAQVTDELPPGTGGFGAQLARTSLALLMVCVMAWWLVRYAARRGMLGAPAHSRHMTVVERVALDARKALHLVRIGKRILVVGASDEGLRTLAELTVDELDLDERTPNTGIDPASAPASAKGKRSFVDALAALTEKKR